MSGEGFVVVMGVNSGVGRDEGHHDDVSAAWGLLRMEERLWLVAEEVDLARGEEPEPVRFKEELAAMAVRMVGLNLPDWEGLESIIRIWRS